MPPDNQAGQGAVSRCRARHFCRVDRRARSLSSSSPARECRAVILITPLFSAVCELSPDSGLSWSD